MAEKLVLIDGNSIAYRAFFALPLLNNDKGVYTNAVYGFTTMLLKILEEDNPDHMLVAFDAGKTTFRHKTYEEYKGGRQKTPPELSEQFPVLKELLDAFEIKHYQLDQFEADDIIGTLATQAKDSNYDVKVISGDKDLLQLVSEKVKVSLTKKGITNVDTYDPDFLMEKMEIRPDQVIDLKALMGDSSDNIPGVPGVGEKTAVKLLKQFDKLETIYEQLDDVSGKKLKEKLENHKKEAFMSKELVTIEQKAPVEVGLEDLKYNDYEPQKVASVFRDLGFQSLISRVAVNEDGDPGQESPKDWEEIEVTVLSELPADIITGEEAVVVEMLHENYHASPIVGISIVNPKGNYFISIEDAKYCEEFVNWVQDSSKEKWVFDAKRTLVALRRHGMVLRGAAFDLLLASYLINPAENNHDIPAISHRMNERAVRYDEEVYGKGAKMKVPDDQAVMQEHITRKAKVLFKLKESMEAQLKENEQYNLYKDLEMPLALILGDMEHGGVESM